MRVFDDNKIEELLSRICIILQTSEKVEIPTFSLRNLIAPKSRATDYNFKTMAQKKFKEKIKEMKLNIKVKINNCSLVFMRGD